MSRIQLALNVSNLDEAVDFYSKFFRTTPAKVRPGYANFAIVDPPIKLVLIEGGAPGAINHLGVEVSSAEEVAEATTYLETVGLNVDVEEGTTCCYAVQDKVWVNGPDSTPWETYVVHSDVETLVAEGDSQCCSTTAVNSPCC